MKFQTVGDRFAERLAFLALTRRLGNLEKLDDLAAGLRCVTLEGFFLNCQRKPFTLLFVDGGGKRRGGGWVMKGRELPCAA